MKVTPAATEQLSKLLSSEEHLSIGLSGGGCGGLNILLERRDSTTTTGLNIPGTTTVKFADQISQTYLTGGELDVDTSIFNAAFVIKPPPGTQSCGCGNSIQMRDANDTDT